jgi:hypothetical protein
MLANRGCNPPVNFVSSKPPSVSSAFPTACGVRYMLKKATRRMLFREKVKWSNKDAHLVSQVVAQKLARLLQ